MEWKITNTTRIDKLHVYLKNLDKKSPVCLVYDDDADGVCSGVITRTWIERLGFETILTFTKCDEHELFKKEFLDILKKEKVKAIVCVDFEPMSWNFISEKDIAVMPFDLIIIDHHFNNTKLYDDMKSKYFRLFLHPLECTNTKNPGQYCATKFSFDIGSLMVNLKDIEWKVLPGMIGDMNIIDWPDYIVQTALGYGVVIDTSARDAFFTCSFGRLSTIIGFAGAKSFMLVEDCFEVIHGADSIDEALELSPEFADIEATYYDILENFAQMGIYYKNINMYFIEIKAPFRLSSSVSSVCSYINEAFNFCFYQDSNDGYYHLSLRGQHSGVHFGELVKHITSKFPGASGGGHAHASGGRCFSKDIDGVLAGIRNEFSTFKTAY